MPDVWSPIKISSMHLPHRLAMAPMTRSRPAKVWRALQRSTHRALLLGRRRGGVHRLSQPAAGLILGGPP